MANDDLILAINAGSSSLKISLFARKTGDTKRLVELILTSSFDGLTAPPATFSFAFSDPAKAKESIKKEKVEDVKDHASAFEHFLGRLEKEGGIHKDSIKNVCHRVVHGGDYDRPVVISKDTYHHIETLTDLAPLHNGAALSVIHAVLDALPKARSIAYFDTTFHCNLPPYVSAYAIDQDVAKERGIKKYGFHGLSYAYILGAVSSYLEKPPSETSLIIAHLGSGASMCAIRNGQSLDTSMGLTPLHGLPGGTRSGAIDPAAIFHYTNKAGKITHDKKHAVDVTVTQAEEILNKQSGWKAITGTSNFGEIVSGMGDDPKKKLAFDLFVDRILTYFGSYHLKLGGRVDALVFAGGVGEKSVELRAAVVKAADCLGYHIDKGKNEKAGDAAGDVVELGSYGEHGKVLLCKTDEQEEMAKECTMEEEFW